MEATERENLLHLYREGKLVAKAPSVSAWGLTDEEVVAIDAAGCLVGTDGYTTIFATCPKCPWHDHVHVEDNDVMKAEAEQELRESHTKMTREKCPGELVFEEESGF